MPEDGDVPDNGEQLISDEELFKSLIAIYNNEVNLRWRIVQFFFLINTVALTLIISQMEPEKGISVLQPGELVHIISCGIGIILGILWLYALRVINGWLKYWVNRLSFIDIRRGVGLFSGSEFAQADRRYRTGRNLSALVWVFIVVWTFLLSVSIETYFKK